MNRAINSTMHYNLSKEEFKKMLSNERHPTKDKFYAADERGEE